MPVDFSRIVVGQEYDRPDLARMWGYKTFNAFAKGAFTPAGLNVIVLFISESQQENLPQYQNFFDDELLWMDGEKGHRSDIRLAHSAQRDVVHLFYRERDHSPFRYCGEVILIDSFLKVGPEPSRFVFTVKPELISNADGQVASTFAADDSAPETEGRRIQRLHIVYERSKKNRDRALEFHGRKCVVCRFDFDAVYGADLGQSFVEVHHVRSITEIRGEVVNPQTDLAPLCANCHRMAHRRREIVPLSELRERVRRFPLWPFV